MARPPTLRRALPVTRAVVFTIHTYVVDAASVTAEELTALREAVH